MDDVGRRMCERAELKKEIIYGSFYFSSFEGKNDGYGDGDGWLVSWLVVLLARKFVTLMANVEHITHTHTHAHSHKSQSTNEKRVKEKRSDRRKSD